ncbi:hypothetical protein N658DRAFT_487946 [Parathielavia hyrcaniae]|uniref:Apple domain-containing protein n=1 Tax=Parathielavia hyrcaniae TaxID=113614 RepID=A0AAN6T055_9PEZI|nr:hypothetical protein N658DRAFT_487946 [Parathielavia hyrcaniae]
MRSPAVVVAGLLPLASVGAAGFLDDCAMNDVLKYFSSSCEKPVLEACADSLAEQAAAWCRDYMSIDPVTVPVSTETPGTTETVTETSTTSVTTTEVIFTTLSTTTVTNITIFDERTETATVTAATAVTARPPDKKRFASKFAARDPPSCDNLIKKNLHRQPAWKLARACGCLSPQPVTVTAGTSTAPTSTTTATETVMATEIESETSVSTDVVTATSTREHSLTLTTTVTATVTPTPTCSVRYAGAGGSGVGNNTVEFPLGTTSDVQCCELCHGKPNCIASGYLGNGHCQLLVKVDPLAGAPTSEQCPLGIEDYPGVGGEDPAGPIMKGPCIAS